MATDLPSSFAAAQTVERLRLMADSFQNLLDRPLVVCQDSDLIAALWDDEAAIVAHGTQPDPLFFFANRSALRAFETDLTTFIGMPSRFSAEAGERAERRTLLERVTRHGFIDDYSGIRISATGRRFRIQDAIVWNIFDENGRLHGQAARFAT